MESFKIAIHDTISCIRRFFQTILFWPSSCLSRFLLRCSIATQNFDLVSFEACDGIATETYIVGSLCQSETTNKAKVKVG